MAINIIVMIMPSRNMDKAVFRDVAIPSLWICLPVKSIVLGVEILMLDIAKLVDDWFGAYRSM